MSVITVRKAHVKRITGKHGDNPDTSIWADLYRIDEYEGPSNPAGSKGEDNTGGSQDTVFILKWQDDPNNDPDPDNGNPARKTETVKIMNPKDHTQVIEVQAITRMNSVSSGFGVVGMYKNSNQDGDDTGRKFQKKRVPSVDVNSSDSRLYMDIEDYYKIYQDQTPNKDVYVDMQFPDQYNTTAQQGFDYEGAVYVSRNKDLEGLFDDSPSDVADTDAVRLDPSQFVINISWGGGHFHHGVLTYTIGVFVFIDPLTEAAVLGTFGTEVEVSTDGSPTDLVPATTIPTTISGGGFSLPPGYSPFIGSAHGGGAAVISDVIAFNSNPPFDEQSIGSNTVNFSGAVIITHRPGTIYDGRIFTVVGVTDVRPQVAYPDGVVLATLELMPHA